MNILVSKDGGVGGLSSLPATSTLSIQPDNNKPQQNCLANLIKLGLMGVGLLALPLSGYAAISATTSQTIQGTAPYLTFDGGVTVAADLNELITIKIPDGAGGYTLVPLTTASPMDYDGNWTFNDIQTMIVPDDSLQSLNATNYFDADNDLPATTPVAGSIQATWTYTNLAGATKVVPGGDLSKKMGVLGCGAFYTLTIDAKNIQVDSKYGDPASNYYGSINKSYQFATQARDFCYLKPWDLIVNGSNQVVGVNSAGTMDFGNFPTISPTLGGGYTSDFEYDLGFKANATTKFPTKAFQGASFAMIMSTPTGDWTFSTSSSDVSITGDIVKINSHPSGPITIKATHTDGSDAYYTFNVDAYIMGYVHYMGWDNNLDPSTVCGAGRIPRSDELTGSPYTPGNYSGNFAAWLTDPNRGLDAGPRMVGNFVGEWGSLDSTYGIESTPNISASGLGWIGYETMFLDAGVGGAGLGSVIDLSDKTLVGGTPVYRGAVRYNNPWVTIPGVTVPPAHQSMYCVQ